MAAALQRLLDNGVITTRCRRARQTRVRGLLPRLLLDKEKGGSWRGEARRCSSVEDVRIELLQD
jgi:hypothetical protein